MRHRGRATLGVARGRGRAEHEQTVSQEPEWPRWARRRLEPARKSDVLSGGVSWRERRVAGLTLVLVVESRDGSFGMYGRLSSSATGISCGAHVTSERGNRAGDPEGDLGEATATASCTIEEEKKKV